MQVATGRGRPTDYTPELAMEICNTIAATSKGIKRLCEDNPHWPCKDTIFTWRKRYPDFSDQYAQAKMLQVEVLVDEMLDIADDATSDITVNEDGSLINNNAAINRAKLKIDTRKWLACKLVPRVYGNKVDSSQTIHSHEADLKHLK